jgi:kynurenine formamidase
MNEKVPLEKILETAPKNWGRWGSDDEIGTLNFLTPKEILSAIKCVRQGKVFSLGLLIGRKGGDLVFPGRTSTIHLMTQDEGTYKSGKLSPLPGGLKYADDAVFMYLQGTTQCDAIGHAWYGDKIYNGYSAETTIGGLSKASIVPIAEKGIVGRGVLLDIPRYKGVKHLNKGEMVTLDDLLGAAKKQGVEIRKHDILLVRTGYISVFYEEGPEAYFKDFNEPGITYSKELVDWFYNMEIAAYGADTLSAEQSYSSTTGTMVPLHIFLMNYLGIPIQELLWLEDLAKDCEKDGQYDFLYVCSPLKFVGGTGSPVNPLAIK